MRVLALTRYTRLGASSRLRFYQYLPTLAELGIEVEVSALLSDDYLARLYAGKPRSYLMVGWCYYKRLLILLKAWQFDLLWIEKELFPSLPAWIERLLSLLGIAYVVDFDDAVFHNYDRSQGFLGRLLSRKIDVVMRSARLVVVGNSYLAQRAQVAGARLVESLPTVLDSNRYARREAHARESYVVGWVGSPSTVKYLEQIAPVLTLLAARLPIVLRVVGAPFSWPNLRVETADWHEDTEVSEIGQFDVGVMPLEDSSWERGKCGYKLIQYMACGIPVVASAVGANVDIVKPCRNGFLSSSRQEWEDALRMLLTDADLRQRLGEAGRRDVEQRYCLQVAAPQLAALLLAASKDTKVA